jgi:hypothetical protein
MSVKHVFLCLFRLLSNGKSITLQPKSSPEWQKDPIFNVSSKKIKKLQLPALGRN